MSVYCHQNGVLSCAKRNRDHGATSFAGLPMARTLSQSHQVLKQPPFPPQNDGLNVGLWSLLSFVSCTCSHRLWFSLTNQEIVLVLTVTGPWSDPLSRWRTNWSLHWNGDAAQDFQDKSVVKVSSAVVRPSRPEVVSLKRGFIHICAFLAVSTTSVPFLCAVCVCNLFFFAGVCL